MSAGSLVLGTSTGICSVSNVSCLIPVWVFWPVVPSVLSVQLHFRADKVWPGLLANLLNHTSTVSTTWGLQPDNLSFYQRVKRLAWFDTAQLLWQSLVDRLNFYLLGLCICGSSGFFETGRVFACLNIDLCADNPNLRSHSTFLRFSRLRKTSFPSLWDFSKSFLALQTALSAHPLEWEKSGLLVTSVKSNCAAKSLKRWLVISLPLSDIRVASEVTSRSRSISYQPE